MEDDGTSTLKTLKVTLLQTKGVACIVVNSLQLEFLWFEVSRLPWCLFLSCREITAELERLTQTLQKLHNKVAGKHDEVHGWLNWKFWALCLGTWVFEVEVWGPLGSLIPPS